MHGPTAVEHRIAKLLSDRMSLEVLSRDLDLLRSGYLDSMTFLSLLEHLEGELGVRINLDDLEIDRFRSIAQITEFITAQRASESVVTTG